MGMTMWVEKVAHPSREYENEPCLLKQHKVTHGIVFPKTSPIYKIHGDIFKTGVNPFEICTSKRLPISWKAMYESSEKRTPERKTFGISLGGIKTQKEEMSIDPQKLEPNVFYLFSYKDEKYVARKSDEDVVEIYEVIE